MKYLCRKREMEADCDKLVIDLVVISVDGRRGHSLADEESLGSTPYASGRRSQSCFRREIGRVMPRVGDRLLSIPIKTLIFR